MKKMLYLSHVPWGWIKQRPHFLAEKLSNRMDVSIYSCESIRKIFSNNTLSNDSKNIKKFYTPLVSANFNLNKLGELLYSYLFKIQIKDIESYSHIWIGSTLMYRLIKPFLRPSQVLIYDCMDDDYEFPLYQTKPKLMKYIKSLEKSLMDRANFVFFSSEHLKNTVISRTNANIEKCNVINNALEPPVQNDDRSAETHDLISKIKPLSNKIMYIGMIAEWFDFSSMLQVLEDDKEINLILVGPTEVDIPSHNRIHYLGKVDRALIFPLMSETDALIMPFVVNDLIKSVNPVKLYEYIYGDKPIIVPKYEEVKKFLPYINIYDNYNELSQLCRKVQEGKLPSPSSFKGYKEFVNENTWQGRADIILKKLL